jgi:hypothetical protein
MSWLDGKKTYIVATLGFSIVVAQAVIDWMNGKQPDLTLLFDATIALAMIFLRKGVSSIQTKVTNAS